MPPQVAKPAARLIKLLIRAHRFNTTLVDGDSMPFAALAKREGVSPSYFTVPSEVWWEFKVA